MKNLKAWCFQYTKGKYKGQLEPLTDDDISPSRWQDGYGIFGTKKDLLDNIDNAIPEELKPVRITLTLKKL